MSLPSCIKNATRRFAVPTEFLTQLTVSWSRRTNTEKRMDVLFSDLIGVHHDSRTEE